MIPKPLNEIEWSDLEALRDSGREEDDTLEFKGSFSGGPDFLGFNDTQRERATKGVAREVIAFLNGRGGDLIIGAEEEDNESPSIKALNALPNSTQAADRLHQALSVLIEPYQAILGVGAIRNGDGDNGIIVVRAPRSLRAPHRFTRDKECYVRRGRESVAMPMDEIQDMTLNRATARSERSALMNDRFSDLSSDKCGFQRLNMDRVHFRVSYVPDILGEIILDGQTLSSFFGGDPEVNNGAGKLRNNVAFRELNPNWRPQLRGKVAMGYHENEDEFHYCRKSITTFLNMTCDLALHHKWEMRSQFHKMIHYDWLVAFFANSLSGIMAVLQNQPNFSTGLLRVGIYSDEGHELIFGDTPWARVCNLQSGVSLLPDFEISNPESLTQVFKQVQIDICGFVGIDCPEPFEFA